MAAPKSGRLMGVTLDLSTIAGLAVALGAIIGGLLLEGGKITDIGQLTAALIVLGGTVGAVMITTPMPILKAAAKRLPSIFINPEMNHESLFKQIVVLAGEARKGGLVSLDRDVQAIADPFLRKTLTLAIDGADLKVVRSIMELELFSEETRGESEAKVFESAGGYAPTIGIIGAVLGLIQVMKHLEDIEAVGHGIAVAFVATVYGVALANIVFLPIANKLKIRLQQSIYIKEFLLEGAIGVAEGLHPTLIRSKLEVFLLRQENLPKSSSVRVNTRAAAAAQGGFR